MAESPLEVSATIHGREAIEHVQCRRGGRCTLAVNAPRGEEIRRSRLRDAVGNSTGPCLAAVPRFTGFTRVRAASGISLAFRRAKDSYEHV